MKNFCGKWKFSAGKQRHKKDSQLALRAAVTSRKKHLTHIRRRHEKQLKAIVETWLVFRIMQSAGQQLRQFGPTAYGREDSVGLQKKK